MAPRFPCSGEKDGKPTCGDCQRRQLGRDDHAVCSYLAPCNRPKGKPMCESCIMRLHYGDEHAECDYVHDVDVIPIDQAFAEAQSELDRAAIEEAISYRRDRRRGIA